MDSQHRRVRLHAAAGDLYLEPFLPALPSSLRPWPVRCTRSVTRAWPAGIEKLATPIVTLLVSCACRAW